MAIDKFIEVIEWKERIFRALSSSVRRQILAYLSEGNLTAGEIAERFDISKPSLSKHLGILENAGLIAGEREGQFIHYRLVPDNLVNTLNGFVQEVCPKGRTLKRESRVRARTGGARRTQRTPTA